MDEDRKINRYVNGSDNESGTKNSSRDNEKERQTDVE